MSKATVLARESTGAVYIVWFRAREPALPKKVLCRGPVVYVAFACWVGALVPNLTAEALSISNGFGIVGCDVESTRTLLVPSNRGIWVYGPKTRAFRVE